MSRGLWTILILASVFGLCWQELLPLPETSQPTGESQSPLVIRDVAVRDLDGRVAWPGDVDLRPVLRRIERGQSDPHRNDGGIFQNREGRLPTACAKREK